MNNAQKQCRNCRHNFVIEPDDFSFYEKMKVPSPTWCPECRLMRKMQWRNERFLYKRVCSLCEAGMISVYPEGTSFPVYCQKCWWSDKWDASQFSMTYDFSRGFFEQFRDLFVKVPALSLYNTNAVNSDFCNYMAGAKNSYLLLGGKENEGVLYSNRVYFSKDSMDLYTATRTEMCYENVQCENSYNLIFSQYCGSCNDSAFLYDCKNCSNCFGCTNLRGQKYHIFNQPHTKQEYESMVREFDIGSYKSLLETKDRFLEIYKNCIHKYANIIKSVNTTGDNVKNAKNCRSFFDSSGMEYENCKFSHYVALGLKDSYDIYGLSKGESLYDSIALGFESNENSNYLFGMFIKGSGFIHYSYNCISSLNLFGCVGLQKKSHCILNKQYAKEEYEKMVPSIVEHMNKAPYVDKKGRIYKYGEFFPSELSPFAYNETIAQEYYPLTKEEAISKGFGWRDREGRDYQVTLKTEDIPDRIKDVDDGITKEIIACARANPIYGSPTSIYYNVYSNCTTAFKIVPQELQFYRRMKLPLPRFCPNCRHYERLAKRNPLKLWHRRCQCAGVSSEGSTYKNTVGHNHGEGHCPNEFETSYASEREEIIYCEECYKREVV